MRRAGAWGSLRATRGGRDASRLATMPTATTPRSATPKLTPGPRTLCIDIGGTGLKALLVDAPGPPPTARVGVETPRRAPPQAVLRALVALIEPLGGFERASVGFPGVVVD